MKSKLIERNNQNDGQRLSLSNVTLLALATGLIFTLSAHAQDNPLAGPKVNQSAAATAMTLIVRDFDGKVEELTQRPELAAADKLPLTAEQRKAVNEIATQRAKSVAKVIRENYDLFLELQNARQSQDNAGVLKLMPRFRVAAKDLLSPPLLEAVSKAVGEVHSPQLMGMVKQYIEVTAQPPSGNGPQRNIISDKKSEPKMDSDSMMASAPAVVESAKPVDNYALPPRVQAMLTLREMGRSQRSVVEERRERTDAMLKAVNATPEQESKIRGILRDVGGAGEPTKAQRREIIKRISTVLTPEQQKIWAEKMRGE